MMTDNKDDTATEDLMKNGLAKIIGAVKTSNELPSSGSNWAFYSSFPAFQTLMNAQASKVLVMMQRCIHHQEAKGSVLESVGQRDSSERFESLVDINDQLLERIQCLLDEAAGIRPPGVELCVASEASPRPFGRFTLRPDAVAGKDVKTSPAPQRAARGPQLGERHPTRPQERFANPPDNSATPFRPRLTSKPHAKVSLTDSLVIANEAEPGFPHPYRAELESLTMPSDLLRAPKSVPTSLPLEETPLTHVRTRETLRQLVAILRRHPEIAIDLEHHNYRTYLGLTCLMQISTCDQDFIVDTLLLWDHLQLLNEVFTDPAILKVFHGASSDVEWLQRDLGLYVVNMYDTGIGARYLGHSRTGLGVLLEHYCGVKTNKEFQLADWRVRPLSEPMLRYARMDTHYLLEIYHKQRKQLLQKNRHDSLQAVWNESRQLCLKRYEKPLFSENSYLELYRGVRKQFNAHQLQALRSLVTWRDEVARAEDESHAFVLPNHMLVMICDTLPREQTGVFACCNPIPVLVRKHIYDIHKLVMAARDSVAGVMAEIAPSQAPLGDPSVLESSSSVTSPHDLSHTESREAPPPLASEEEKALLRQLTKPNGRPALRLRSVSGPGGGGPCPSMRDPLRQYLLTAMDFQLQHAKDTPTTAATAAAAAAGEEEEEKDINGHPDVLKPTRPKSEPEPSFRLERPTKKVRLEARKREEEEKAEEKEEEEEEKEEKEEEEEEEEKESNFQAFDYNSARLSAGAVSGRADRMINSRPEEPNFGKSKAAKKKTGHKKSGKRKRKANQETPST